MSTETDAQTRLERVGLGPARILTRPEEMVTTPGQQVFEQIDSPNLLAAGH